MSAHLSVFPRAHVDMPKGFWTYDAPTPPSVEEAIALGAILDTTTREQWHALTPGMRREIVRTHVKKMGRV